MRETISACSAFVVGIISYFVGGFDMLLSVFMTILIIDTLTGVLKAKNTGQYESSLFRKGFFRKTAYLLAVVLTVQIDLLSGSNGIWRDIILTFFTVNESISIIENLGELGVSFPAQFTDAIKSLQEKNKKKESK